MSSCAIILGSSLASLVRADDLDAFRTLVAEGRYREAVVVGEALRARGLGEREPALRTAVAACWIDEAVNARRAAALAARVLGQYYRLVLERAAGSPEFTGVELYAGLSDVVAGHSADAAARFRALGSLRQDVWTETSRCWLALVDEATRGASNDPAAKSPKTSPPRCDDVEAALAFEALGWGAATKTNGAPATRVASPAGERARRIEAVLAWIGSAPTDPSPLPEHELKTPIAFAGPPEGRSVPLHDPLLLLAYARGCLARAAIALPAGAPSGTREAAYHDKTRGRLEFLEGRIAAAADAFRRSGETAHLAALCEAILAGSPERTVANEVDRGNAKNLADLVALLVLRPEAPWAAIAPHLAGAVDRWEVELERRADAAQSIRQRDARWAAAAAWNGAGDLARAAPYAAAIYDVSRHGDARANPALFLPEVVNGAMGDLNNQTFVLRAVSETARFAPCYWGVYDALQGYFIHRFVDASRSIRN